MGSGAMIGAVALVLFGVIGLIVGLILSGIIWYLRRRYAEKDEPTQRVHEIISGVGAGDVDVLQSAFQGLSSLEREQLHRELNDAKPFQQLLPALDKAVENPDADLDVVCCWLHRKIEAAWHARTSAAGSDVGEEQWQRFFDHLVPAARRSVQAWNKFGPDAELATGLLICQRADVGDSVELPSNLFELGRQAQPSHFQLHIEEGARLSERWGGSHEALWAFATGVSQQAPKGSALHGMVAFAACDRFGHALAFGGDVDAVINDKALIADTQRAFERFAASPAGPNQNMAANWFAAWFSDAQEPKSAAVALIQGYEATVFRRFNRHGFEEYKRVTGK